MNERDSIFVDLENLNVVFKSEGRFTVALNFSSALDRLLTLISSRKPGYDVYLVIKPKRPGTGDLVIDELSMTGFPCEVSRGELTKVLSIFRKLHGVNDVYLCNWVHNYIACARVDNFESVFYYGNGVMKLAVEGRMVKTVEFFDSQIKFHDAGNVDYSGYGDVGLVDTDGLVARYPELRDIKAPQLTILAPLIRSYKDALKLETEQLYSKLIGSTKKEEPKPEVKDVAPEPAKQEEAPAPKPVESEPPLEEAVAVELAECKPKVKQRLSVAAKLFVAASVVLAFTLGASARMYFIAQGSPVRSADFYAEKDARIAGLQRLVSMYNTAEDTNTNLVERVAYAKQNTLGITIVGFEHSTTETNFRCACASNGMMASFEEYLGEKYTVVSSSDLGEAESNGQTVYQFTVSVM